MWTSSIAVAARIAASPAAGPAQSRTSIGRSRLPPAASVAAASAASGSPWPATSSRRRSSTAAMRARQPAPRRRPAPRHRRRDGLRFIGCPVGSTLRRLSRLAPEWIAMIPPASTV